MRVICCQLDITWEDKRTNHEKVRALIEAANPAEGSLVLLPEMFATGFSMNIKAISDSRSGETQNFLSSLASRHRVYVAGGIVTDAHHGRGYNQCVVYSPDGKEVTRYTKIHPFSYGKENAHFTAGSHIELFKLGGFTIAPFICYDLRFPELFRFAVLQGANLFTVIASWPAPRDSHWVALLKARAIENQAYVVGVNRCGSDPNIDYKGHTMTVDPSGNVLLEAGSLECTISDDLDFDSLLSYRKDFPALKDIRKGFFQLTNK